MFFIRGQIVAIVTFPGIVMAVAARKFMCDLIGIPVYEAVYIKGTIAHEVITRPARALLVALAPLIVSTSLCAILLFTFSFSILFGSDPGGLTEIVLAWIGISIGVHALPAYATVRWYLDKLPEQSRRGATYYFLWLMAPIMSIVGLLKWIWFDVLRNTRWSYGAVVCHMALHANLKRLPILARP
jgi:hypothetical protein